MSQYHALFTSSAIKDHFQKDEVDMHIRKAREAFKKKDKILWYLRIYRHLVVKRSETEDAQTYCFKQEKKFNSLSALINKSAMPVEGVTTGDPLSPINLDAMFEMLKHYMDLGIASIEDYQWGDESLSKIIASMKNMESLWRKKQKRKVSESGKAVLTKGDLTWFNLCTSGCQSEGRAMGHCGNGVGRKGQVVYSLRSKHKEPGFWVPHVTLILNNCKDYFSPGYTSEIKGYANTKPDKAYHEAILALLTSELVIGMSDEGYLPENNFRIADLSHSKFKKIAKSHPHLLRDAECLFINKKGDNRTEQITRNLIENSRTATINNEEYCLVNTIYNSSLSNPLFTEELTGFKRYIDHPKFNEMIQKRVFDYDKVDREVFSYEIDDLEVKTYIKKCEIRKQVSSFFNTLPFEELAYLDFKSSSNFGYTCNNLNFLKYAASPAREKILPFNNEEKRQIALLLKDRLSLSHLSTVIHLLDVDKDHIKDAWFGLITGRAQKPIPTPVLNGSGLESTADYFGDGHDLCVELYNESLTNFLKKTKSYNTLSHYNTPISSAHRKDLERRTTDLITNGIKTSNFQLLPTIDFEANRIQITTPVQNLMQYLEESGFKTCFSNDYDSLLEMISRLSNRTISAIKVSDLPPDLYNSEPHTSKISDKNISKVSRFTRDVEVRKKSNTTTWGLHKLLNFFVRRKLEA
tara:strand:+ start:393 stop:2468 length:2076 start_codon:yes stop_codon:yes gene_type:complete